MNRLLDFKVSTFRNVLSMADKEPQPLRAILTSGEYKERIEAVRAEEYHSMKQKELKKGLPLFAMGVFDKQRRADKILEAALMIALDFDSKDNEPNTKKPNLAFRAFKYVIENDPYVLYCGLSCSGKGWRVILPIRSTDRRKGHYMAAVRYFHKRYGMVADEACKDVAHAFFVSYDEKPYINEKAKPFPYELQTARLPDRGQADNTAEAIKLLLAIEKAEADNLEVFSDYDDWVRMGLVIASTFGEDGRIMFHRLSALSPDKYNEEEADTKYNNLLASRPMTPEATLASVYWQLSEAKREKSVEEDFNIIK
jgi:hypothetical protein